MLQRKNIGKDKALQKIRQYCSYQERSQQEVRGKLYSFGLYKADVETLVTQMIEENYLNEERFATSFAGGKFRIKHWGRVKIKYELKQRRVSEYCIKIALASINTDEYAQSLQKLMKDKQESLKTETNSFVKKQKLQSFLLQKGYESNLITEFMHKI